MAFDGRVDWMHGERTEVIHASQPVTLRFTLQRLTL